MLDPEYVERVETEMAESGGQIPPGDHKKIWQLLGLFSRSNDMAEFALSLLTDHPLLEILELANDVAAKRHPNLPPQEAIECELRRQKASRADEERR